MLSEEKVKDLKEEVLKLKEEASTKYVQETKEIEKLRNEYQEILGGLKTLSELTETDEIKSKIEEQSNKANEIAEKYNGMIKTITEKERNICCFDGVIQACMYILEEENQFDDEEDGDEE